MFVTSWYGRFSGFQEDISSLEKLRIVKFTFLVLLAIAQASVRHQRQTAYSFQRFGQLEKALAL